MNLPIYFEKQKSYHCAIHTVNSILQSPIYTPETFDFLAKELYQNDPTSPFINPYKSPLGTGNYDINVMEKALNFEGYSIKWHDFRRKVGETDLTDPDLVALVINDRGENDFIGRIMRAFFANHWFAIRKMENKAFFNLDSRLKCPEEYSKEKILKLIQWLEKNKGFLFFVYRNK